MFVNSNDDHTAFSLLFKKFGYVPFSYSERDKVMVIARNVAKFVQFSDAFALGESSSVESYTKAADEKAKSTVVD